MRRLLLGRGPVVVVLVILTAWYAAFAVERYRTSHMYGDEPEYFLAGQSVWQDGDLNLRNQFLHPDHHAFPGPMTFKVDPAGGPAPANFLPSEGVVLIEPADEVGGVLAVYLLFAAMNLVSLYLLYRVLRRWFEPVVSALTIGIVGLSVPLAWFAASVWTEVPALLIVSAALALAPRIGSSRAAAGGVAAMLAALPWLHQKYFTLALFMALALLLPAAQRRLWPIVLAGPVAGFAGTVILSFALRDRWNFTISGTTDDVSSAFNGSLMRFLRQPLAWLFDQTRGSLPLAPVWILAGVGLVYLLLFRPGRRLLLTLAVAFVPFFLVYFWGPFLAGDSPPGRETLPAVPVMAILLAAGLQALRGWLATTIAAVLAGLSVAVATIAPFRFGFDIMFNNVGRPKLLDKIATARFTPADLWPQMTAAPGAWSLSTLLMTGIAVLAVTIVVLQASRAAALRGGRVWIFAGETASRPTWEGARRALREGLPGAARSAP